MYKNVVDRSLVKTIKTIMTCDEFEVYPRRREILNDFHGRSLKRCVSCFGLKIIAHWFFSFGEVEFFKIFILRLFQWRQREKLWLTKISQLIVVYFIAHWFFCVGRIFESKFFLFIWWTMFKKGITVLKADESRRRSLCCWLDQRNHEWFFFFFAELITA